MTQRRLGSETLVQTLARPSSQFLKVMTQWQRDTAAKSAVLCSTSVSLRAACFILLVIYIILKVHFCNKKKPNPKPSTILIPPKASSGVENMTFQEDSTPRLLNPVQQIGSVAHSYNITKN